MRCLILGAGGFIGSNLCESLINLGYEVFAFSKPTSRYIEVVRQKGAKIIFGDFLNPKDVELAISSKCDVIFHLISTTIPETSNEDTGFDIETNIFGTLQMLEMARKAKIKKVVFVSSGGTVYGIPQEILIKESHPTNPISSYGISKLTIEKYLYLYWDLYGLDYCILRVANAYGENQPVNNRQGFISNSLYKAINNKKITIWGNGSIIRDYVYIMDVVNALTKTINYSGKEKIFNIGTSRGYSIVEVVQMIEHVVQVPLQINYDNRRLFDVPSNVLDYSLAKTLLDWDPKTELSEGMLKTFHWIKKMTE